jgi:hypothetical protein
MSRLVPLAVAAGLLATTVLPVLADSSTTRIETRPFYGATVTLEEGVRVFRPLPPTKHMIINPQGRTPLNLTFEDVRVSEQSDINVYNHGGAAQAVPVYGHGGYGYYAPRHVRGDHPRVHRSPAGVPVHAPR